MSSDYDGGKTVVITEKDYAELCNDSCKLKCLEEIGVENWEGYSDAMDLYERENEA
jgi:hypothetical protein